MLSLLDVADRHVVYWHVVFTSQEVDHWFTRHLAPGFQHCFAVREYRVGRAPSDSLYVKMDPYAAMTTVDVWFSPPWVKHSPATIVKVAAAREVHATRSWFHLGPISCVEQVKMLLGIRAFFVRTPRQLHRYLLKHNGVLIS